MIKANDIVFEYIRRDLDGNVDAIVKALDGINIDIKDGEFVALLGHNGSGKSTVLEAATIAAGTLTSAMYGLTNYGIKKSDAHYRYFDLGSNVDVQPQFPVEITAVGAIDGREISWTRSLPNLSKWYTQPTS